jgi:acetylornithine deacetylase/succinyl-diaminopimelate desuccinylase-like protein
MMNRRLVFVWGGAAVAAALGVAFVLSGGRRREHREIRSAIERDQVRPAAEWLKMEPVKLLHDYIAIDTTSRDGPGEREGAVFLQRYFDCAGIESELVCPEPSRCNLLARIPGKRREGALLLVNHIDVVGVYAPYWREAPPFSGNIKIGYMYGRGSYDMKSIGLAQAIAFRRLKESGVVPETDILFLAEADEEYEQRLGSKWLLEHRPDWFSGVGIVLNEGGMNEAVIRTLRFWGIDTLQAGYGAMELESPTQAPLEQIASKFQKLDGPFVDPDPQVVLGFDMLANHLPYPWTVMLRHLEDLKKNRAELSRLADRYGGLLEPRARWSKPYAFPPGQDKDFRCFVIVSTPPGMPPDGYLDRFAAEARRLGVKIRERQSSGGTTASPYPTGFTDELRDMTHAFYPGLPFGPVPISGGTTTSQWFRNRGFATYGYTPILMNITDEARRHFNDERVFLRDYLEGIEIMDQVVLEYAFFPKPGPGNKTSAASPGM